MISSLVFAEVEHMITRNVDRKAAHAVQDWLLGQERNLRVLVPEVTATALRRARTVQSQYAALRLDLADAVNVVLAEQYETDAVVTLDRRDFRAIRPLSSHAAFRILPDDL
ncbi:PIN domain-containing protein [Solwaraspora sp. WMMB335]|uniref:PIN domain-containing protein n=1 Tax=Solwaraspora sp. WMMB335 TaxID=3404118 RepID=UPI003B92644E